LIFALAVCAGFGLKQCEKMVADAHAAVLTVCSDGLKLLMFVKFYKTAISILCKESEPFSSFKHMKIISLISNY